MLADPASAPVTALAADALERSPWPPADFAALLKEIAAGQSLKLGAVMKPVRAALTGSLGGPELADVLRLLGRERALARLRASAPAAR